jgi:D-lactate dehydrogenase (cytochrome)
LSLAEDLARVVGADAVSTEPADLLRHGNGFSYHAPVPPQAVVRPRDKEEVCAVLRFASAHRIPVVPFGAGSSIEGQVIPVRGGISLDLSRMNAILEVRPRDFMVRVQPGVTRLQLQRRLREDGLFFPIDPGADAAVGGMVGTNASGSNALRYGMTRQHVLALEMALPDGRLIRTGSLAFKTSAGYNLTQLLVGSEGTLGVFTEIALRVYPIPPAIVAARAAFPTLDAAAEAAVALIGGGVLPGRCELVDASTMAAVNAYEHSSYPERPTLFLEFLGRAATVAEEADAAETVAKVHGCLTFERESDPAARERLWQARHHAALAIAAASPGKGLLSTDVCVPLSVLPAALRHARETLARHGVSGSLLGHVGDGNYHAGFMVDHRDRAEVERAERVHQEIVDFALRHGGTCTGEHGVGVGKRRFLAQEHGDVLPLMRAIKAAFDPAGIMNPGKLF